MADEKRAAPGMPGSDPVTKENLLKTVDKTSDIAGAMIARGIGSGKKYQAEALQFKRLLDHSNDAIFVARPEDGRVLDVNETACKRLGYSRDRLLAMHVYDFSLRYLDAAAWRTLSVDIVKAGSLLFETEHRRADGSTFPVEVNVRSLSDETGDYLIAVVRDLSKRRETETALRKKDLLLRRLTANVPILISYIDKELRFVFCNEVHQKIFNRPTEGITGALMSEVLGPEAFQRLEAHARKALSGAPAAFEAALPLLSGETRHFNVSFVPNKEEDGRIEGFFSALTDITTPKELERNLLHSQKMEALGTLASGIAHEFNNILAAIMMQSYSIRPDVQDMPAAREAIDDIISVTERARDLISEMKSSTKPQEALKRNTDINGVLTRILRMVRPLVGERIAVSLTTSTKSLKTGLNEAQFEHVIMNLILNSRDAIAGTGTIAIRTSRAPLPRRLEEKLDEVSSAGYLLVEVRDDGSGISPAIQNRIFEPFFSTKMGEGFGLGLAMVYRIVKNHKGLIDFESKPGEGTTFRVYLPEIEITDQKTPPAKTLKTRPHRRIGMVLIAEDDLILLDAYDRTLKRVGYHTLTAKNGKEAMLHFKKRSADIGLVLLDLMMPKLLGHQAYEKMRKVNPNLKVLFVTGQAGEEVESSILSRGLPLLAKPFTPEELITAVEKAFTANPPA